MMYFIVLSLLAQLVAALRFGKLINSSALDYAVSQKGDSIVSVAGETFDAWLELKSESLMVHYMRDMQISLIHNDNREIPKLVNSGDEVKVQPGDLVIIHKAGPLDLNGLCTAELLTVWVNAKKSTAVVFGVAIKDELGAKERNMPVAPNNGLTPLFFKGPAGARLDCLQSTVKVFVDEQNYAELYLKAHGQFVAWSVKGVEGMFGNIRSRKIGEKIRMNWRRPAVGSEVGDLVIIVMAREGSNIVCDQMMTEMENDYIEKGEDALNNEKYSELTIFVAKIDNAVDYLKEIVTVGKSAVENALFDSSYGRPAWLLKGNTMIIQNDRSVALHIKKNEKNVDDSASEKLQFTFGRVELSQLQPGDIVVVLTVYDWETATIDPTPFKNALSDCITAEELKIKLKGLQFQKNMNMMAAIISDKIQAAESSVAEPMEEEGIKAETETETETETTTTTIYPSRRFTHQ